MTRVAAWRMILAGFVAVFKASECIAADVPVSQLLAVAPVSGTVQTVDSLPFVPLDHPRSSDDIMVSANTRGTKMSGFIGGCCGVVIGGLAGYLIGGGDFSAHGDEWGPTLMAICGAGIGAWLGRMAGEYLASRPVPRSGR